MKTFLIIIEDAGGDGSAYPVHLYELLGSGPTGERRRLAGTTIPVEASIANTGNPGKPTTPESVLALHGTGRQPEAVGTYLAQLLKVGGIWDAWNTGMSEAAKGGDKGRRSSAVVSRTLLDVRPTALKRLPWELLCDGKRFLFNRVDHPVARLDAANAIDAECCNWPLKVLIVVGCARDDKRIRWQEELDSVLAVIGRMGPAAHPTRVLRFPSVETVVQQYERFRPHVFHFIGHGEFEGDGEDGALELWVEATGRTVSWKVVDIVNLLQGSPPHVVLVNACRSAATAPVGGDGGGGGSGDGGDDGWPVSRAFLTWGARAVIGMQGDVPGDAAATFAAAFYETLGRHGLVERAVAEGRRAVWAQGGRAWSLPSLTLATSDAVLCMEPAVDEALTTGMSRCAEFECSPLFVDREDHRQRICDFLSRRNGGERFDVMVIHGEREVGKSALVRTCLHVCVYRRHRISYLDLRGETYTFTKLIERIVTGDAESPVRAPLGNAKLPALRAALDAITGGTEGLAAAAATAPLASPLGDEQTIAAIAEAFADVLREAAATGPVVVVLDHLMRERGILPTEWKNYVWPYLVKRAAAGQLAGVRLVLIADNHELDSLELQALRTSRQAEFVECKAFPFGEYEDLAFDFFLRSQNEPPDQIRLFVTNLAKKRKPGDWKPVKLHDILRGLQ